MPPRSLPTNHRRAARVAGAAVALALCTAGTVALAAEPALAAAASVRVDGEILTFRAAAGQANDLRISVTASGEHLVDDVVPVVAGPGCAAVPGDATVATCQTLGWSGKVYADMGDGNDKLRLNSGASGDLNGGPGNDELTGGSAYGAMGEHDFLRGGDGNDTLDGAGGEDYLDGGPGADKLVGGAGTDRATYQGRTRPVTADLDGAQDDGEAGERDLVAADVEGLTGGAGNDVLTGNAVANFLNGGAGDDVVDGAAGADLLYGGLGVDTVRGGDGADQLNSGDGGNATRRDVLDGGTGNDLLFSGMGAEQLLGGAGVDTVSYTYHTSAYPVVADPDGETGDDGFPGESDSIGADVENLSGTGGDDTLIGNGAANELNSDFGNDVLLGLGGDDRLNGHYGDDVVVGGAGRDTLEGDVGSDLLRGQDGTDTLDGGEGPDTVDGGAHDDTCRRGTGDTVLSCEVMN